MELYLICFKIVAIMLTIAALISGIIVFIKIYKRNNAITAKSMFECNHINTPHHKVKLTYVYNKHHLTITRNLCCKCIKNALPVVESIEIININNNKTNLK